LIDNYDVLVIGGGMPAAKRPGFSAHGLPDNFVNINLDSIALMSCNPAIGA